MSPEDEKTNDPNKTGRSTQLFLSLLNRPKTWQKAMAVCDDLVNHYIDTETAMTSRDVETHVETYRKNTKKSNRLDEHPNCGLITVKC